MTVEHYRPQIGETLFVSLYNNEPFVVTVTGFDNDTRFSSEQFKYRRKDGRKDFATLCEAIFYPNVPIDTAFIYAVEVEQHEFMERSSFCELGFFFDPTSAFAFIDSIIAGTTKPRIEVDSEFFKYSVRVLKV